MKFLLLNWRIEISKFLSSVIIVHIGEASDDDDNDQDTLKETLLETNPYLLGLTIIVSILHSVFEFLAFKNGKLLKTNNRNVSRMYCPTAI